MLRGQGTLIFAKLKHSQVLPIFRRRSYTRLMREAILGMGVYLPKRAKPLKGLTRYVYLNDRRAHLPRPR
jgi:hypothetical protein